MENQEKLYAALEELVDAIGSRWDGESEKKRANAISPRMEDAIANAKLLLEKRRQKEG